MKNTHFRYLKPGALLSFVIFLAIGLYLANQFLSDSFGVSLSVTAIITGLFLLIDRFLWKSKPFSWLYWVPDLSGRYEGHIEYSNPITTSQERKQCAVEVFQTGSKLKVSCFFRHEYRQEPSLSRSLIESIVKNDDETYTLVFTYQNQGNQNGFPTHFGTNILDFIQNGEGKFLKGYYYTNRDPQTKGTLEVKYISQELKNDF